MGKKIASCPVAERSQKKRTQQRHGEIRLQKGHGCLRKEEGAPPREASSPVQSPEDFSPPPRDCSPPLRVPRDPFEPDSPEPESRHDINSKFYGREPVNRITSDARSHGTLHTGTNEQAPLLLSVKKKKKRTLAIFNSRGISYKI